MIFWFFDDFWKFCFKRENPTKPRKSSKNHQKIIVLLEKQWKSTILASFLVFFMQNDIFLMIFWWFPRFEKSSKNHRFAWKTMNIQDFGKFSWFFQAKRWFFDDFLWFPRFCLIFSFEAKPSKIIEKSSKNYQKIIVLLEKTKKTCQNLGFSCFFKQNDDFLMIS